MTLRLRLAVLLGALVAAFVVGSAVFNAWLADSSLRDTVDQSLSERADVLARFDRGFPRLSQGFELPEGIFDDGLPDPFNEAAFRVQIIQADGEILRASSIPVDEAILAEVKASGAEAFYTVDIDDRAFRVLTRRADDGVLQLATSIESIEAGLATLRGGLLLGGLVGVMLAMLVGWFFAGRFTRPIVKVTAAAATLATSGEVPEPIKTDRTDEIGQLAASFNDLVAALELSRTQQAQLVGDAGHELRTPLTSLRVKVDFLNSQPTMAAGRRQQIVAGVALELESLTTLVNELLELATGGAEDEEIERVDLGPLIEEAAARARLLTDRPIVVFATGTEVMVRPEMVRRALTNLIENAHKFSPPGAPIEINESNGEISVRDFGPGIAVEDRPHAFERFFRSPAAENRSGSGIGLAIVKDTAEMHGGRVWVDDADGGGAVVGFSVSVPD